jgi:hypothetical protein
MPELEPGVWVRNVEGDIRYLRYIGETQAEIENNLNIFFESYKPIKQHEDLLKVLELGDILYLYDSEYQEYFKAEIYNIGDDLLYDWAVRSFAGDEDLPLESLILGLIESVEIKGILSREKFMKEMFTFKDYILDETCEGDE